MPEFLTNATFWLHLAVALALVVPLAAREAFRFRLLRTRFGLLSAYLALACIIGFIVVLVLMARSTGIWSAVTGAVFALFLGGLLSSRMRGETVFDRFEEEQAMREVFLANALRDRNVAEALSGLGRGKEDLERLQRLLLSQGVEERKVGSAIRDLRLLNWYFTRAQSADRRDVVLLLVLWARRGEVPPDA